MFYSEIFFFYRSFWKSFFTEITRLFLKSGNAKLKMCEVNDRKGQESILTLFQQFWPRKNGSNRMVHFTCVQFELLMNFCGWRMKLHMAFVKPQCELIWWKIFNTHTHTFLRIGSSMAEDTFIILDFVWKFVQCKTEKKTIFSGPMRCETLVLKRKKKRM